MSVARSAELESVLAAIRACRHCIEAPHGKPLPHEPRPVLRASPTARLAVCSQAPGTKVHASGTPFTDRSGDRLREWMGVTPRRFLRRSPASPSCRWGSAFPGRMPRAAICRRGANARRAGIATLFAALPQLELVLAVGAYAQEWHLGEAAGRSLQETMLAWRQHLKRRQRPRVLPLPHPSWRNNRWLTDNPWFESELLPVLRREVRRLM